MLPAEGCFTSLATMSSLMRMKSRRFWGSTPSALWMLRRSAAMSGRVDDSAQRGLRVKRHSQSQTQRHCVKPIKVNITIIYITITTIRFTQIAAWAVCIHNSWGRGPRSLPFQWEWTQHLTEKKSEYFIPDPTTLHKQRTWGAVIPACFCWNSPATKHFADSIVRTMLVERML